MVWAPHGYPEAVDSLLRLANVVLLDSAEEPDIAASLARVSELAERVYVVDLAWLRSTPWRERVAFTFDPCGVGAGARADQRGHGAPPCGLGGGGAAAGGLAGLAPGMDAGGAGG